MTTTDYRMGQCLQHGIGVIVRYDADMHPAGCPLCARDWHKALDRPMSLRDYDAESLAPLKYGPPTGGKP